MSLHLRINCGSSSAVGDWQADAYSTSGSAFNMAVYPNTDLSKISNPAPLKVYDDVRYDGDEVVYSITGLDDTKTYRAILHWAETNADRRFYVSINGVNLTPGIGGAINVLSLAGNNVAYTKTTTFAGSGTCDIVITSFLVNAFISGIEVIEIVPPAIDTPFNILGLIPEKYMEDSPDFQAVTNKHVYEDEGVSFNTTNDVAPRRWIYEFTGLSEAEAAVFDDHFKQCRFDKDFGFTDRRGYIYDFGIYYENYQRGHERNKRWIQTRSITLVKYP